jgi:hypothetical protein
MDMPLQGEYFPVSPGLPLGDPSRASESTVLASDASKTTKRKPLLLLVEDNDINLKVCLDMKDLKVPHPSSSVSGLMLDKASRNLYKEEQLRVQHSDEWSVSAASISKCATAL